MPYHLYKKVRHILETTPGLTQRGLATRMGVNPAAVNRMLYGRRKMMAEEIPVIEAYLGQSLSVNIPFGQGRGMSGGRRAGISDITQQSILMTTGADGTNFMPMVPVFEMVDVQRKKIIDHVPQFPAQMGCRDAFALYVVDDMAAPRYSKGDVVYIHPNRPLGFSKDCFVRLKKGGVWLCQFLSEDKKSIEIKKYGTEKTQKIPHNQISEMMLVVGRG